MIKTIHKAVKGVAVVLVALSSTVFQANGCSINVTGMDKMLEGLVDELESTDVLGSDPFSSGSSYSGSDSYGWDDSDWF